MITEIGEGFLSLNIAKAILDIVSETYSRQGNIAQVYDQQQCVDRLDKSRDDILAVLFCSYYFMAASRSLG